jgi:Na+/phosphate symporter
VLEAQREAEHHHELSIRMIQGLVKVMSITDAIKRQREEERLKELKMLSGRYESEVKTFLERLARSKTSGATYRQVQFLLEWCTDIGQTVELMHDFLEVQMERERNEVFFAPKQRARLVAMLEELRQGLDAMAGMNHPAQQGKIVIREQISRVERHLASATILREQMRTKHLEDSRRGRYSVESGRTFNEMANLLEEIGLRMGILVSKYEMIFRAS